MQNCPACWLFYCVCPEGTGWMCRELKELEDMKLSITRAIGRKKSECTCLDKLSRGCLMHP